MNVNIPFADQLYGNDETAQQAILDNFSSLGSQVTASWLVQHNADDTHGTITATGSISERGRTTPMGEWITVPYTAVSVTPDAFGTVSVAAPSATNPVSPVSYTLIGKTMIVNIGMTVTIGGAPFRVFVSIPGSYRTGAPAAGSFSGPSFVSGGFIAALAATLTANGTTIAFERVDQSAMAAGTYAVGGLAIFQIA